MFFKIGVLKNVLTFTEKHVSESLFDKIGVLQASSTGVILWILNIFKNTYFEKHHLETAAFEI